MGKEFPSFHYEVSREKVREFLRALNEEKEIYWDQDKAKQDLFDLINTFRENIDLSELEINKLREKYFRINQSTRSQLIQLGLMKEKNLCRKYLKIFERFDNKKNEKLMKIVEIIDES